jgi:GNAT superfamily N-acetyltransferase
MAAISEPTSAFAVRPAAAADIPVLAHHRAAMYRDMGTLAPQFEDEMMTATQEYLQQAIPRGEYVGWVAHDQGAIIGGAGVQFRSILPRPCVGGDGVHRGPEAIVLNVYVEPAFRRRGVAEILMRTLLNDLSARRIARVVLHASAQGRPLYERLGFVPTNEMRLQPGGSAPHVLVKTQ